MNNTQKIQELSEEDLKKVAGGKVDRETNRKRVCNSECEPLSQNECVAAGRNYDQTSGCCC